MSALPGQATRTAADLDAMLDGVVHLLDRSLEELRAILAEAGRWPTHAVPGPLEVDLVGELAARARNHGKRIRPSIAHWGFVAGRGADEDRPLVVRVGAALELLHLFALIQDDVMDRSERRRGEPTIHVLQAARHRRLGGLGDADLFGDSIATLVGDLALSEATLLIGAAPRAVRACWRVMAVELVEGQLLDLTHAAGRSRDVETSRQIARFKSGRYTITRPLELGVLVAGADPAVVQGLSTWGDHVGEVFAIRDDLLGVWGDPERTGKPAGDDLLAGKPTVLLSWAQEMLPPDAHHLLSACDGGQLDAAGAAALQDAMTRAGVQDRAEQAITDHLDAAATLLDGLDIADAARAPLSRLAHDIAWRTA